MANTIELAKKYLPILDEVYKVSSKTSLLDAPASLVREGMTANSILIPKVALQGLADYDNATGFVNGDVTFECVSRSIRKNKSCTRSRRLQICSNGRRSNHSRQYSGGSISSNNCNASN